MTTVQPAINLVVIRSSDIDRAAKFYELIGLTFTKHRHGNGPQHFASEACGIVFEIYPLQSAAPTTSVRIGFCVSDVDAVVQILQDNGGAIVSAARNSQWGRRAVMRDLDGHTIELVTPPNPDPA